MIRAIFRTRIGRAVELVAEFAHDLASAVWNDRRRQVLGIAKLEREVWALHDRMLKAEQDRLDEEAKRKFRYFMQPDGSLTAVHVGVDLAGKGKERTVVIEYGDDFAEDSPRKRADEARGKVGDR